LWGTSNGNKDSGNKYGNLQEMLPSDCAVTKYHFLLL